MQYQESRALHPRLTKAIETHERPRRFLASGLGNRLRGALFHFMYHNRNGYPTGAPWNGNLLPRILKRPLKVG